MKLNNVILHLGSNLGNSLLNIEEAINHIDNYIGHIEKMSTPFKTAAWGLENQPDFINSAIFVQTHLTPLDLLNCIHFIEKMMGRQRKIHWGERIIDIDIIFYSNLTYNSPQLIIPHKYMHERNFVLVPLNEICPNYVHPKLKKIPQELLDLCKDSRSVNHLSTS